MSSVFQTKKQRILEQLTVPQEVYNDRSPKGSIDEGIRELVDEINAIPGLVTTSSCAGRISVFLEGKKKSRRDISLANPVAENASELQAIGGLGGKGGGKWLFISHDPVPSPASTDDSPTLHELFGLRSNPTMVAMLPFEACLVHFKFEAMILHVLTASLQDAQTVLSAAFSAGFRESGAVSLSPNQDASITPVVAVRSTGLAFDTIVGYQNDTDGVPISVVTEAHLRQMLSISIERFRVNSERIQRFKQALLSIAHKNQSSELKPDWEDKAVRQARKREEGLARQRVLHESGGKADR